MPIMLNEHTSCTYDWMTYFTKVFYFLFFMFQTKDFDFLFQWTWKGWLFLLLKIEFWWRLEVHKFKSRVWRLWAEFKIEHFHYFIICDKFISVVLACWSSANKTCLRVSLCTCETDRMTTVLQNLGHSKITIHQLIARVTFQEIFHWI